jgi:hypothetical protein
VKHDFAAGSTSTICASDAEPNLTRMSFDLEPTAKIRSGPVLSLPSSDNHSYCLRARLRPPPRRLFLSHVFTSRGPGNDDRNSRGTSPGSIVVHLISVRRLCAKKSLLFVDCNPRRPPSSPRHPPSWQRADMLNIDVIITNHTESGLSTSFYHCPQDFSPHLRESLPHHLREQDPLFLPHRFPSNDCGIRFE